LATDSPNGSYLNSISKLNTDNYPTELPSNWALYQNPQQTIVNQTIVVQNVANQTVVNQTILMIYSNGTFANGTWQDGNWTGTDFQNYMDHYMQNWMDSWNATHNFNNTIPNTFLSDNWPSITGISLGVVGASAGLSYLGASLAGRKKFDDD
jgi:hypothetical protein